MKPKHILVINPGSTSTKVAVYEDDKRVLKASISHPTEEIKKYETIFDQLEMRKQHIMDTLKKEDISLDFDAVVARGGLAKPVEGGVYVVDQDMLDITRSCDHQHACDLGCFLAHEIARETSGCPSFIADPGVTDELCDYARVTGSPLITTYVIWHALNQRAIARRHAKAMGTKYEDLNLIICHLGGGISVAAHEQGRAIDANNALDGSGPFSPERAGTLPAGDVVRLCFSGKFTEAQMHKMLAGQGGLAALMGTNNLLDVENRILEGDKEADFYTNAMIYHVCRAIAAEGAVLKGKVDAILLTGGVANSKLITDRIKERISWIAPVYIYPGEDELEALAQNALMVLRDEVKPRHYSEVDIKNPFREKAQKLLAEL